MSEIKSQDDPNCVSCAHPKSKHDPSFKNCWNSRLYGFLNCHCNKFVAPEVSHNYYVEFKPTIWHRLGFGDCSAPPLEDEDYPDLAEGSMTTNTWIHLDWKDRLRVLISGNVMTSTRMKTNVQIDGRIVNATTVSIPPPGAVESPGKVKP